MLMQIVRHSDSAVQVLRFFFSSPEGKQRVAKMLYKQCTSSSPPSLSFMLVCFLSDESIFDEEIGGEDGSGIDENDVGCSR